MTARYSKVWGSMDPNGESDEDGVEYVLPASRSQHVIYKKVKNGDKEVEVYLDNRLRQIKQYVEESQRKATDSFAYELVLSTVLNPDEELLDAQELDCEDTMVEKELQEELAALHTQLNAPDDLVPGAGPLDSNKTNMIFQPTPSSTSRATVQRQLMELFSRNY